MEFDIEALEAEGWEKLPIGPFSRTIGQSWSLERDGKVLVGVLFDAITANENIGIVHGGAMLTFADISMGYITAESIGKDHCATVQLQYQFAGAVQVGEFCICEAELVRKTKQLVFARGLMKVGDRIVGSADAVFKVLHQEQVTSLKAG
ncbi:MAG: PaaI family thioesterase [Novosphingobium sp.]|nr:PaaI family thioesterase [Novosphingobium sp.]